LQDRKIHVGKLITVVGNAGSGKTTLTRRLCQALALTQCLEQHAERPFQALFAANLQGYALPNQIDYLLLRAEQEAEIRRGQSIAIQDGGLDQDLFVFTRFFFHQGYLTADEYDLCRRLHRLIRSTLPPADLIIRLSAPLEVLAQRHRRRNRTLEIATVRDLPTLEALFEDWMRQTTDIPLLTVDAGADDPTFADALPALVAAIQELAER
jgi:deoxyadenosine/deoxycytidine kinase